MGVWGSPVVLARHVTVVVASGAAAAGRARRPSKRVRPNADARRPRLRWQRIAVVTELPPPVLEGPPPTQERRAVRAGGPVTCMRRAA
jgi:hypothetical protein